jgi:hypothetical protein
VPLSNGIPKSKREQLVFRKNTLYLRKTAFYTQQHRTDRRGRICNCKMFGKATHDERAPG